MKIKNLLFTISIPCSLLSTISFAQNTRLWATYYGGTGYDEGHNVVTDASGNVYLTGITDSPLGIASGGFQNTYAGTYDAYLVKFDAAGNRLWATYYGDISDDDGQSIATDAAGNVYLAGDTRSTAGIASGGFQNTYGGTGILGGDAFLVKFDANGNRIWATYYGGTAADHGTSVATDASGNIYLAGYTASSSNIASGGFQNTTGGGTDAFLVKFDTNGNRIWATYYGGTGADDGYGVATDATGNVYLSGFTGSNNAIASGGFQNTYAGGFDAFLVKFDATTGNRIWGTYYGGTGTEYGYGVAADVLGNVYFTGMTNSTSDIASGGFQNVNGGGNDVFLVKFDAATGNLLWGTYYGGPMQEEGFSVSTDPSGNGNVYLAADSYSASGIASGGFQNTFTAPEDCFLAKFDAAGNLTCATYYGATGNDDDEYGHVAIDPVSENVYLSGSSRNPSGIASGGFQNTLGGNWDGFLVKFTPCSNTLNASINSTNIDCYSVCSGSATIIATNGTLPYTYTWSNNQTTQTITSLCAGAYTCTVKDSVNDSVVVSVTITEPAALVSTISQINGACNGLCIGSATVNTSGGTSGYTYSWIPVGGTGSSSLTLCPGNDTVIITDANGCLDTAAVIINFLQAPIASITGNDSICSGQTTILTASGGGTYNWNTGFPDSLITVSPLVDSIYSVIVTSNNGCTDTASITVIVNPLPSNLFAGNDTIMCMNDSVKIGMSIILTVNETFNWFPSTSLSCDQCPYPTAGPAVTTTYTLTTTTEFGCQGMDSVKITINTPSINAGPDDTLCSGASVQLNATSGFNNYQWIPATGLNDASIFSPVATPSGNISYAVIGADNIGCVDMDTLNLIVQNSAVANFTPDPAEGQIPLTVNFTNSSTNASIYEWTFGDSSIPDTTTNPQHIYTEGGEYPVQLIANNSDDCPDTSIYTFINAEAISVVWIPNSFSPNDDGVNDLFMVYTTGITELEVLIFNRWGELIYKWNMLNGAWDGKYKSSSAEEGVYVYVLNAKGIDRVIYRRTGHMTLIR